MYRGNAQDLDKKTILELIDSEEFFHIWDVSEEFREDPEIVLAFVKKSGDATLIKYAGENLRNDKNFIMEIARWDHDPLGLNLAIHHAGDKVKKDRDFFIEVMQYNPEVYEDIDESLKDDSDLRLLYEISKLGSRYNGGPKFENKVELLSNMVKRGVTRLEQTRPYSLRVDLENLRESERLRWRLYEFREQDIYIKEPPEEIDRQIKLLEHIKEFVLNHKKSLLQQKETELSSLEAEEETISKAEALLDKQHGKEGQDIGEE